ncbi:MAG: hypothetical protein P8X82_04210, partial [Gemmatimonadales bacterium]
MNKHILVFLLTTLLGPFAYGYSTQCFHGNSGVPSWPNPTIYTVSTYTSGELAAFITHFELWAIGTNTTTGEHISDIPDHPVREYVNPTPIKYGLVKGNSGYYTASVSFTPGI